MPPLLLDPAVGIVLEYALSCMKAVLFDFGGTLDSDGLTWPARFFPLYRESGLDVPQDVFLKAFYRCDDHLAERFSLAGTGLERTLELQVGCVLEELPGRRVELTKTISRRFLEDCRRFFTRNKPVLERLRKRYKLGIVSNFYGNLPDILASEGMDGFFDVVAESARLGHTKPAKEIFLHATGALGVEPADCLMVGDSVPRDMKGAEGLAMPHALLNPSADACCASASRLATLPDVERLLS